jgi:prepilin-type N-terminal cleavage/methylation domain-containing protein
MYCNDFKFLLSYNKKYPLAVIFLAQHKVRSKIIAKVIVGDLNKLTSDNLSLRASAKQSRGLPRRSAPRNDHFLLPFTISKMPYPHPKYLSRRACNRGLSLIEVMVSLLIISIGIVGFGMAIPMQKDSVEAMQEERIALLLAKQMMEEIQSKAYEDPNQTPVLFGLEPGENASRINFDDIDDYNGWDKNPPQYPDGTSMDGNEGRPDYRNFRRQVIVENVDDSDYSLTRDNGATSSKRITVTVSSGNDPKPFDDIVMTWVANREGMELLY